MKSGIELIATERREQIEKHKRTILHDIENNDGFQLVQAASILCTPNPTHTAEVQSEAPFGWDEDIFERMINKDYKQRLIIAGALIAAEIDRIENE
jgi:hypothetical protein